MNETEEPVKLSMAPEGAGEASMIAEQEYGAVHSLYAQGMAKKRIAALLGLDPKTVRKWLNRPLNRQQRRHESKVEPWREFLEFRGPEVGWNGAVLHREVEAQGFAGSYITLARYVAQLRPANPGQELATLRFETEPGQQAQVDWGEILVWINGVKKRVHFFTMVLGFSRRIFARAYLNERLDSLLDAHSRAFEHFGGRTSSILYDNPRTIVHGKDEATGRIDWQPRFKDAMDFYGVECRLCHYYRAQTKGKVESGVKYVKRNALVGKTFGSLEELNEYLLRWCLTVADERVHGTTGELPSVRFARQEASSLIATGARSLPGQVQVVRRRVPRDAYVALERNRYPVWWEWTGLEVEVRRQAEEISIYGPLQQRVPALETLRYVRLSGRHQTALWAGPSRGLPPAAASAPPAGPPRFDVADLYRVGEVENRSPREYQQFIEEVAR